VEDELPVELKEDAMAAVSLQGVTVSGSTGSVGKVDVGSYSLQPGIQSGANLTLALCALWDLSTWMSGFCGTRANMTRIARDWNYGFAERIWKMWLQMMHMGM
jgi:hypothetical protein